MHFTTNLDAVRTKWVSKETDMEAYMLVEDVKDEWQEVDMVTGPVMDYKYQLYTC